MSVQIKQLTNSATIEDLSGAALVDSFNVIPAAAASKVYDLYTAQNTSTAKKSAIVKGIRLTNIQTSPTAPPVKVTLYFNRPTSGGQYRRRLLAPTDIQLPSNFTFIDDSELTLEPGDKIQAKADTANVIQYVISGVERDVS